MLENAVEFWSSDRQSGGFFKSALIVLCYAAVLAGLLQFSKNLSQHTTGQIWNRKSGTSGTKSSERGETVTFVDIAGVDEAKEELQEIVPLFPGESGVDRFVEIIKIHFYFWNTNQRRNKVHESKLHRIQSSSD